MRAASEAGFAISGTVFGDDILLCDFAPLGLCVGFFSARNLDAPTCSRAAGHSGEAPYPEIGRVYFGKLLRPRSDI